MQFMSGQLDFDRTVLDNSVVLLVSENQRFPLISLSAFVVAGSDQNPSDQPGLASLTARLLDEGTGKYESRQLSEMIEGVGASLSTFSQRELSGLSLQLRSEDLSMGLNLLAQMLCDPTFPEDRFDLESKKVLNDLQAMEDDPYTVASTLFSRWIYRDSPFQHPIPGTVESVEKISAEDVRKFHREKYAPQCSLLVLIGALDSKRVLDLAGEHFSRWRAPAFRRNEVSPLQHQKKPVFAERFMAKEQINVFLGHLGISRNNPDYYPLQVMDMILGSGPGFTSRIPRKLRDEQGLAYTTYSDICASSGIYPGRFAAYVSTSPENRQKAVDGLLGEIEGMIVNGVTDEELSTAQDFLTGSFVFDFQSNAHVARFLLASELFGLGIDYPRDYPKIIRSVSCEDVSRVARQYLDTVNYTSVIVGPTR